MFSIVREIKSDEMGGKNSKQPKKRAYSIKDLLVDINQHLDQHDNSKKLTMYQDNKQCFDRLFEHVVAMKGNFPDSKPNESTPKENNVSTSKFKQQSMTEEVRDRFVKDIDMLEEEYKVLGNVGDVLDGEIHDLKTDIVNIINAVRVSERENSIDGNAFLIHKLEEKYLKLVDILGKRNEKVKRNSAFPKQDEIANKQHHLELLPQQDPRRATQPDFGGRKRNNKDNFMYNTNVNTLWENQESNSRSTGPVMYRVEGKTPTGEFTNQITAQQNVTYPTENEMVFNRRVENVSTYTSTNFNSSVDDRAKALSDDPMHLMRNFENANETRPESFHQPISTRSLVHMDEHHNARKLVTRQYSVIAKAVEEINNLVAHAKVFEMEVKNFRGKENDTWYIDLREELMQVIFVLDSIKTLDNDVLKQKKRKAFEYVNGLVETLEQKTE